MQKIEIRTQTELERVCAEGNIAVCIGGGKFYARAGFRVEAWENSSVVARENSSVEARGNSSVEAWENSSVVARENSSVVAWGNSSVVAWGNSSVEARGNSSVVAWGNSSVEAWENSSVEAWANVFVRVFSALKIKAQASVLISVHGKAEIEGGNQHQPIVPQTPHEWCQFYGVAVVDEIATVYKALDGNFASPHGTSYAPGTIPSAEDWDNGRAECGGGLHFSPTPMAAREFNSGAVKYVACPVALSAMRNPHRDDVYPQKIKAIGCCGPVYEVDIKGRATQRVAA